MLSISIFKAYIEDSSGEARSNSGRIKMSGPVVAEHTDVSAAVAAICLTELRLQLS